MSQLSYDNQARQVDQELKLGTRAARLKAVGF